MNIQELQAINEKVKELGWYEWRRNARIKGIDKSII